MICIFTEAGGSSGFGHLTRCLSLYDECVSRGLEAKLIINAFSELPDSIGERVVHLCDWLDLTFLQGLINSGDYAIIDSYLAPNEAYDLISRTCVNAVFIDDYIRLSYPKGVVVSPSLYGDRLPYPKTPGVCFFGGPDYIILRSEFLEPVCIKPEPTIKPANSEPSHFLITMGGTDIFKLTAPVLSVICKEFPDSKKSVVLGSGTFDKNVISEAADKSTEFFVSLDAKKMRDIMIQADFAITAAGQTIHELLRCGVSMIPILVADNQRLNIRGLENLGFSHINALDKTLDPDAINWKSLVAKTPRLAPMTFEGHRNIIDILIKGTKL